MDVVYDTNYEVTFSEAGQCQAGKRDVIEKMREKYSDGNGRKSKYDSSCLIKDLLVLGDRTIDILMKYVDAYRLRRYED